MISVILLILWVPMPVDQPPALQVLKTYESMKACTLSADRLKVQHKDLSGRVACVQLMAPLADAGSSF